MMMIMMMMITVIQAVNSAAGLLTFLSTDGSASGLLLMKVSNESNVRKWSGASTTIMPS